METRQVMTPYQIRARAREELTGRWPEIIQLHLIPILLSTFAAGGVYGFNILSFSRLAGTQNEESLLVTFLVTFITIGISYSLLDLIRSRSYKIRPVQDALQVFSNKYFLPIFLIQLLMVLFVTLWSLLLIIPGIIMSYAYSQAFFIYKDRLEEADDPKYYSIALECLAESKDLMRGHKARLFFLHLSFIGWYLLEAVSLGLASLYVRPYLNMAEAVFYADLAEGYEVDKESTASEDAEDFADF